MKNASESNSGIENHPPAYMQALYERFPCAKEFDGELTGRRLLRVCGTRTKARKYDELLEADQFWFAFEGDDSAHDVWVHPDWIVDFFSKTWTLLPRCILVAKKGEIQLKDSQSLVQLATWQALVGMYLVKVNVRSLYDESQNAALQFRFAKENLIATTFDALTANLLVDCSETWEETATDILQVSNGEKYGQFALHGDVQDYLTMPRRAWDTSDNTAVYPWDDEEHFQAMSALRVKLQIFVLWMATDAIWRTPLKQKWLPMDLLWQAINALSVFQVALAHGVYWDQRNNYLLDHNGDTASPAWVNLGKPNATERTTKYDLQDSKIKWLHLLACDTWTSMLDSDCASLDFEATKAAQAWLVEVCQSLKPVEDLYAIWRECFFSAIFTRIWL